MGFLWTILKLGLLGGGISSVVLPSLMAAGFKEYNGRGKTNNTRTPTGWTQATNGGLTNNSEQKKRIDGNAVTMGKHYGISVGRIPWKTKISGKLDSKCKNDSSSSTTITLGNDSWNVGRSNWKPNQNLFGEIQFSCQNKSGTLFLKWEGGSQAKKGWYGRVVLPEN